MNRRRRGRGRRQQQTWRTWGGAVLQGRGCARVDLVRLRAKPGPLIVTGGSQTAQSARAQAQAVGIRARASRERAEGR